MVKSTSIIIFILSLFSSHCWALSKIEITLDKNPVSANERFTLKVTADDSLDSDAFDSSFLLKNNFIVGSTSVSKQVRVTNGSSNSQTIWTTTLMASKAGDYSIPAISIDGIKSNSIKLRVEPKSNINTPTTTEAVKIVTSLSKNEGLVGEMLFYKVELHVSAELARGANLSEPKSNGAIITQLGEQQQATKIINGKKVLIVTINYSVSTNSEGSFNIIGPSLNGEMVVRSGSYNARNRYEPIFISGQDQVFNIKKLPHNIKNGSIVSPFVSLSQKWQPTLNANKELKVGEAVTRTITLLIANQGEAQLPELKPQYPLGIRHYADEISTDQIVKNDVLFAQLVHKEAIIATKEGLLNIPEVSVPWFNTKTQTMEYATLPALSINVLPGDANVIVGGGNNSDDCPVLNTENTYNNPNPETSNFWPWLSAVLFALWLGTLLLLLLKIQAQQSLTQKIRLNNTLFDESKLKAATKALETLGSQTDSQFRAALLDWAQKLWPNRNITCINEIPSYASISPFLAKIDKALWAGSQEDNSQAKNLINTSELFKALMIIKKKHSDDELVGKLNP